MRPNVRASVFVLVASACSSHGAPAQPDEEPLVIGARRPVRGEDPRVLRMLDGLERVRRDLETGSTTPNAAFEAIEALEHQVGPPTLVIPVRDDACTTDDDCGLTDRVLAEDAGGYRCCAGSNIYTAGNQRWLDALDTACEAFEPLRGSRAIELPSCGTYTGPISANTTRCDAGRCVACLQPHDESAPICH